MTLSTQNLRIARTIGITSPQALQDEMQVTPETLAKVAQYRQEIQDIIHGRDNRLLIVVGPCSIHDPELALEYARRLAPLRDKYADRLLIVMRVYFEKPRTTVGWKGLINDPDLNDSFDIEKGLRTARTILNGICEMGLPTATEILDPITPPYIADLICWGAIGARTTESQTHRQMASGLSMPVGFKNGTDGSVQIAIDAMCSATHPHHFIGIDSKGQTCILQTAGNADGHLILRGGNSGPNFNSSSIAEAHRLLIENNLPEFIMIDCSHANSGKQAKRQGVVMRDVLEQRTAREAGAKAAGITPPAPVIAGVMLESHINEGKQKITLNDDGTCARDKMAHGVSITDECIGWEETEALLAEAYEKLNG